MAPERTRVDIRADEDVERILDWLSDRTGFTRPRVIRLALWAIATRLGMADVPKLGKLLAVRPGRQRHTPARPHGAAPEGEGDA